MKNVECRKANSEEDKNENAPFVILALSKYVSLIGPVPCLALGRLAGKHVAAGEANPSATVVSVGRCPEFAVSIWVVRSLERRCDVERLDLFL